MRCLGSSTSSCKVNHASSALRGQLRPDQRNRFLANCWLSVLAPRRLPPCALCLTAAAIALTSKPQCAAKRWSSAAITAIFRASGSSSQSRHWRCKARLRPASRASKARSIINKLPGGSIQRRANTARALTSSRRPKSLPSRRSRRLNI